MKSILEEIESLRDLGKISEERYQKLKKVIEEPVELDVGKIFSRHLGSKIKNVLDVAAGGSGTGPKVFGKDVIALDISKEEINSALRDGAFAQWICADARNLPLKPNSIDLIFTFVGLAYIIGDINKIKTLREAHQVLKKNGLMLLIEPEISEKCHEYVQYFIVYKNGEKVNEAILGVAGKNIAQSKESLIKYLRDTGFKTETEEVNKILIIICTKT